MNIATYIPLKAALVSIYDIIDEDDIEVDESKIIEWASNEMRLLSVKQTYDHKLAFLIVSNHKAALPCGFKIIDFIAYKHILTDTDIANIKLYTSDAESNTIGSKYMSFINSDYFKSWTMLRMAVKNSFMLGIHCKNPINMYAKCEHEYSVDKYGFIHTSFKDGYLALSYYSYPQDSEGNFLIPDDEDIKEAIKDYCFMKLWEKRMNLKEENSINMYNLYKRQYKISHANAKGKILLPQGPDGYENLKQQLIRFGQNTNHYYSGFGNLNQQENISLNIFGR
ncbi:MAG: hypothetical protein KatS3mg002_1395 [Candidatus Woesearchaeota archaeon]|nr:MAG: hypothetical protein KatS3mg002_1395 [Candidatus Woesearchaeota archaeon]